jgi:hypothetical protein
MTTMDRRTMLRLGLGVAAVAACGTTLAAQAAMADDLSSAEATEHFDASAAEAALEPHQVVVVRRPRRRRRVIVVRPRRRRVVVIRRPMRRRRRVVVIRRRRR